MARPKPRFYVDTSVAVVDGELAAAPLKIRRLYEELLPALETVPVGEETLRLQRAYLEAGILSPDSALNALHIALATISGAQGIVSWNFKHIVHFQKIPKYNAVNQLYGWQPLGIYSPQEVLSYEDQNF